jgi:hypothetical protein
MGLLSIFGIGVSKDSDFSLAKTVMDSVSKVGTLNEEALKKEVESVMSHVVSLGEGQNKDMLIGAISDSFKHPVEVLSQKDKISKVIDSLYKKCREEDEKALKNAIGDSPKDEEGDADEETEADGATDGKDKKDKSKKDKEDNPKDSAKVIEEAIAKALSGVSDSLKKDISTMVDETVKKALGLEEKKDKKFKTAADSVEEIDAKFLVDGIFGIK